MKESTKIYKIAFSVIAVFAVGILLGYQLNGSGIASIQGYLFNSAGYATASNATNSNATNSNATNSNATNSNATNSNATNSNATNSNATNSNVVVDPTYDIIYLSEFGLASSGAKAGDRVSVSTLSTSGATLVGCSITFKSMATGAAFTVNVVSLGSNPYFVVPTTAVADSYIVTDVLLTGKNKDSSTFTRQFNINGDAGSLEYSFNSPLTVTAADTKSAAAKAYINSISLGSSSAKMGDKVYVNIKTTEKITSLKLTFSNDNGKLLNLYVKSLDKNPYFEIPTNTTSGTYKLVGAILESNGGSTVYNLNGTNGISLSEAGISVSLDVSGSKENSYLYNNEDITSSIITKIYNLKSGSEITINADSNTIINSELFNAIKGTDKKLIINYKDNQIVFNGKDITDPKAIDVHMTVGMIEDHEDINELINSGIVISFADNSCLPGKALIRVKATDEMNSILGNSSVYIYFYNENDDNFCEIAKGIKKTSDGYYEFNVTHHSDYVIVKEKLKSSLVVSDITNDDVVTWQKSKKVYVLLIIIAVVVIGIVTTVIIIQKKKGKKKDITNLDKTKTKKS